MTIISPLPFALANGATADASQVMADLNQIRGDVNTQFQSGSIYRGSVVTNTVNQLVNNAQINELSMNTTLIDTASISDGAGKLTVPSGVLYARFFAQITYNNSGSSLSIGLSKAGIPYLTLFVTDQTHTDASITLISPALSVTAGDYFSLFANSAGATNINGDNSGASLRFEMQIIG